MQGRLYEVNGYPGAVRSNRPGERVLGELYRVPDAARVFPILDEYEGVSGRSRRQREYVRSRIPVTLAAGRRLRAWVYLYNRSVADLNRIASGDYLDATA